MRITWRDAITTLIVGGAVTLEYAYFHNWDWPLVSNMRWTIAGLAILSALALIIGYVNDKYSSGVWDLTAVFFGVIIAALTTFGMIYVVSDYVVLLMLTAMAVWFVSIIHHLVEHTDIRHMHAHT
jgi:hypothetical protein